MYIENVYKGKMDFQQQQQQLMSMALENGLKFTLRTIPMKPELPIEK